MTLRRLGAALAAVAVALVPAAALSAPASATAVPYTDPASHGFIGFCNKQGQPITSGSLTAQPFVWTAVSSVPAPTGYTAKGSKAVLQAFQPREGDDIPGDWSGEPLTGSSVYSNPKHPMAQATIGDDPLSWFTGAFPPTWDGFIQLRMYFSAPNQVAYSYTYPTTDIQVTGNTWHVVRGGTVPCNVGTAVSDESVLLSKSELAKHVISPSSSAGAASGGTAASGGSSAPAVTGGATTSTPGTTDAASGSSSGGSGSGSSSSKALLGLGAAVIVVALAAGGFALSRRRGTGLG